MQHDERRQLILDKAQELFQQNGYSETSVARIIEAVGIAKGTFYHYFQSRDELLEELSSREADRFLESIRPLIEKEDNAVQKINALFAISNQWKIENATMIRAIVEMMHSPGNLPLRESMKRKSAERVTPLMAALIREGCEQGFFSTPDPDMTAMMILLTGASVSDAMGRILLKQTGEDKNAIIALARSYETAMSRILGAKEGTIQIFNEGELRRLMELIENTDGQVQ